MLRDRAVWGCASTGASRGSRTIRSRKGGVQFIGRGGRRAEGVATCGGRGGTATQPAPGGVVLDSRGPRAAGSRAPYCCGLLMSGVATRDALCLTRNDTTNPPLSDRPNVPSGRYGGTNVPRVTPRTGSVYDTVCVFVCCRVIELYFGRFYLLTVFETPGRSVCVPVTDEIRAHGEPVGPRRNLSQLYAGSLRGRESSLRGGRHARTRAKYFVWCMRSLAAEELASVTPRPERRALFDAHRPGSCDRRGLPAPASAWTSRPSRRVCHHSNSLTT